MLDSADIINLLIVCMAGVGICFFLAHRRVAMLSRNKFGVFIIYLLELLLCIPAGVYTNKPLFRILLCASLLFTIFACTSHFLENTEDKFLKIVHRFCDAMITVCLFDIGYIAMSQLIR